MEMKKLVLGLVAPCLVVILISACATSGPQLSDEELIEVLTEESMEAIKAQDVDKLMTYFSEDFSNYQVGDKEGLRDFITNAKDMGYLDGLEVDLSEKETTINGNEATGGPVILKGSFGSIDLMLDGVKEEGAWKVIDMDIQM